MKRHTRGLRYRLLGIVLLCICTAFSVTSTAAKYISTITSGNIILNVTAKSTVVEWEKVYGDDNAPYEDANGKYYIRYVGDVTHRTWVDVTGYGWENGKILDTTITSTYKMFEKSDNTQSVNWVFLDYSQLGDLNSNMLSGQEARVSVVYRDNNITDGDVSVDTLNMVRSVYPQNDVYWWLEQSTVNGDPYLGNGIKAYLGNITSVYVPASATSVEGSYTIAGLFSQNRKIQSVMIDPAGTWTSMAATFQLCLSIKEFPAEFAIPATVTNMNLTFSQCLGLERFTAKIPDGVTLMNRTFNLCAPLTADITLPAGVTDCRAVAQMSGYKEPGLSNLVYDDAGNFVGADGKYNLVIRYNGSGSADYGTSLSGMKYDAEETTVFINYGGTTTYSATGDDETANGFGFAPGIVS